MNVKASYIASGLTTRTHGNTKCLPHNSLKFEEVRNVFLFINGYAEQHAILLPGRVPGFKRDDLQLLPSSTTKKVNQQNYVINNLWAWYSLTSQAVWVQYKLAADSAGIRAAAYTTFCRLWRELVPHITVMKPMSDLCWVCQQNSTAIMRATNHPETQKTEVYTYM